MDHLLITIIAAIILMGLAVIALGIGWLLTGKSRLRKGCGFTPKRGKKGDDSSSCPLCGSDKACDKKEEKKP